MSSASSDFKFGSGGGFNFTPNINVLSGGKFTFGQTAKQDTRVDSDLARGFEMSLNSASSQKAVDKVSPAEENVDGKDVIKHSTVDHISIQQKPPKTPSTALSPGDDGYYVNQEGEDDHIYFPPVVKLPENVEIKTGEEEEELLYCQRAKLFRFIESEWKERGIGEVRILRHKQTGKTRILMRRDQVLKICMNHALTRDLELKPMLNSKGKAWVWHAEDFAEDKLSHEQFAIRFASVDIAKRFKEIFDAARDNPKSLAVVQQAADEKHSKTDFKSSPVTSENTTTPKTTAALSCSSQSAELKSVTLTSVFGERGSPLQCLNSANL
jgi:E3 SUMO-protein ligase RanBP2